MRTHEILRLRHAARGSAQDDGESKICAKPGISRARKTTLLPKRTPVAVNVRLLRKSECGARINLRSPERRAAERKHDAEPPRGEHRVVSPNHGKKFCLFQNFFRELQSGFPSLSRKSQHLFCEICAKPRITRAWQNHTFA